MISSLYDELKLKTSSKLYMKCTPPFLMSCMSSWIKFRVLHASRLVYATADLEKVYINRYFFDNFGFDIQMNGYFFDTAAKISSQHMITSYLSKGYEYLWALGVQMVRHLTVNAQLLVRYWARLINICISLPFRRLIRVHRKN